MILVKNRTVHPDFKSHCWGCEDELQLTRSAVNRETAEENSTPLKYIMPSTLKLELHLKLLFFKDISVYSWDCILLHSEMILSPSPFLSSISRCISHHMLLYDIHVLFYFWWVTKYKPYCSCVHCCGATHETIETTNGSTLKNLIILSSHRSHKPPIAPH